MRLIHKLMVACLIFTSYIGFSLPLVWHPANEIMGGTFPDPSYIFSQNLTVNGSLFVNTLVSCQMLKTSVNGMIECGESGQNGVVGGIGSGSESEGYIARWNGSYTLTNSVIYQNGTNVGIGTTSPTEKLEVNGNITLSDTLKTKSTSLKIDQGDNGADIEITDSSVIIWV